MGNTFTAGTRIGDYVVEREAGDGYEAVHVLLPRRVRLEVMHPTFIGLRPVAVRMMREACILEALRHPGVPRIFEVGLMNDQRTNRPWVASELVEGEALVSTGVLSPILVLELIRDLADIVAHAHERGIVHRSLRADIVVRDYDGARGFPLCIVDWSDARVDGTDRCRADDIFALGVIAHQALTGHLPTGPSGKRATHAPARLCMMIDDLLVANPMSRPSAAEVRARAKLILDTLDEADAPLEESINLSEGEESIGLEDVLEISSSDSTVPQLPVLRTRWTPPLGVATAPPPRPHRASIGVLKPRS